MAVYTQREREREYNISFSFLEVVEMLRWQSLGKAQEDKLPIDELKAQTV